jgi:hypothetical protein
MCGGMDAVARESAALSRGATSVLEVCRVLKIVRREPCEKSVCGQSSGARAGRSKEHEASMIAALLKSCVDQRACTLEGVILGQGNCQDYCCRAAIKPMGARVQASRPHATGCS